MAEVDKLRTEVSELRREVTALRREWNAMTETAKRAAITPGKLGKPAARPNGNGFASKIRIRQPANVAVSR
jgi:hypothetical protein